jgi:hypothetical protein
METYWHMVLFSVYYMFLALVFGNGVGKYFQEKFESNSMIPGITQRQDYSGCGTAITIVAVIIYMVIPVLFPNRNDWAGLSLFSQITALALGGLISLGLMYYFKFHAEIEPKPLKIPFIISMVLAGFTLITMLILPVTDIELPFSFDYFWIPIGLPILLALVDIIIDKSRQASGRTRNDSSTDGSSSLDTWVTTIELYMVAQDKSRWTGSFNHHQEMRDARQALQAGTLDQALQEPKFFSLTEEILINLVLGREVVIKDQDVYQAREEVIRTLQAVYFYAVDRFPQYDIHPVLKKVIKS